MRLSYLQLRSPLLEISYEAWGLVGNASSVLSAFLASYNVVSLWVIFYCSFLPSVDGRFDF